MMNLPHVNQLTHSVLDQGIRVLHANLFAKSAADHIQLLATIMNAPHGATVLDAGCGVGEVARLMREIRPDLKFILLNISDVQLAECPADMEKVLGNFNTMPLPDASVDVVMYHYAICHSSNWVTTLREANRVLKPGGSVFINDMARTAGNNDVLGAMLNVHANGFDDVRDWALRAGFDVADIQAHTPVVQQLRGLFESPDVYDSLFKDINYVTWVLHKRPERPCIESAFARHKRIGFQFSGGRDSTAALFELRAYWDQMTVYHLDTGDQFPETQSVVAQVEAIMGKPFVRITTDVAAVRKEHGLASDLVPVDNSEFGRKVSGQQVKIMSRYDCCYRTLMAPMHQRLMQDGITLIVRGQRDDEYATQPLRSGDVENGIEVLYPIQDWTGLQVSAYLAAKGYPVAPFYERGMKRAPECMSCTAWWDEGRAQYMRDYHPESYKSYATNMKTIRIAIDRQYAMLD